MRAIAVAWLLCLLAAGAGAQSIPGSSEQAAPPSAKGQAIEQHSDKPEARDVDTSDNAHPTASPAPILQSSKPPEKQSASDHAAGKESPIEPHKGLIDRTFEDPVALYTAVLTIFTGVLAISTIGLWLSTRRLTSFAAEQARDMKDSIAINKVSADAAKKSADVGERALTHLERPYLFLTYERPDFSNVGDGAMSFRVRFKFKNYGRTPAIIRHVCADVGRFERLPETLTYDAADSIFEMREMVVGPTDETEEFRRKIFALERDEANAVQAGKSFICLYGTLSYDDVFETRHGSEFCWIYDPHRNSFWRSERHNSET